MPPLASLTDDVRAIICDRNVIIIQAVGAWWWCKALRRAKNLLL